MCRFQLNILCKTWKYKLLILTLAGVFTALPSASFAVLLAFDGEAIFNGGAFGDGFGLTFNVAAGDPLSISFDYDPSGGISRPNSFKLEVGGFTFESTENSVSVINDDNSGRDAFLVQATTPHTAPHVTVNGSVLTGTDSSTLNLAFADFSGAAVSDTSLPDPFDFSLWPLNEGILDIRDSNSDNIIQLQFRATQPNTVPLEILAAVGLRETFYGSRTIPDGDTLVLAADVQPNPLSDSLFGPGTTVSFEQNGTDIELVYVASPAAPDLYGNIIPYDPKLTGNWTVTATNPNTENTEATLVTYSIGNQPAIDPVTDMRISGSVDSFMTLFWENPADSDATFVDIVDINLGLLVHSAFLPAGTSMYEIPEVLSPGFNLTAGTTYEVTIRNTVLDAFDNILARAGSSFEFTATQEAIDAFLPTVNTEGEYNFDVGIEVGDEIFIDPFVAVGYDYLIGDPVVDPLFASVLFPVVGDNLFDLLLYNLDGTVALTINALMADDWFDFTSIAGFENGITGFGVRGIETSAMLNPDDPLAFVTGLTFTGEGRFTGTMTPITVFVPEPGTTILFILGLAGLGFARRKKA